MMRLRTCIAACTLAFGAATAQAQQSPAEFIGIPVGADSTLADWSQIGSYLVHVAETSAWAELDTIGTTTLGKPFLMMTLSSPGNLARSPELKANQRLLADPRVLDESSERRLVAAQPAVVLINNNIHSTEIASSQFSIMLAHRLVSDPEWRALLENVVVLLIPSANPDGLDTVVSWYRTYKGTAYEGGPLPWLYHPYAGHDNNRDWYMLTQAETRATTRILYHEWFPEVVWDVHQMGSSGPRMFLPPFADPVNPNLDPMLVEATNLVGTAMATELYDARKTGIEHHLRFDLWWHGGFRTVPARHNMIGILSEVASARLASPRFFDPESLGTRSPTVARPEPWPGGWWGIGDIIEYELLAARGLIETVSSNRGDFVARFVRLGRRAVERGTNEPPYAYIIPPAQRDPGAVSQLVELLELGGVEVGRAAEPFIYERVDYPAGTIVISLAQPFRGHVKDLFDVQHYPEEAGSPYDASGWTLPQQMGVAVIAVEAPLGVTLTDEASPPFARTLSTRGTGDQLVLTNGSALESTLIARALQARLRVSATQRPVIVDGVTLPAGSVVISGSGNLLAELESHAAAGGVQVHRTRNAPTGRATSGLPRIGLYHPWTASMDEGWTRWVLETHQIPHERIHNDRIRSGNLDDLDVILFTHQSSESILQGRNPDEIPIEFSGGVGADGVAALQEWVIGGGTIIALGKATGFILEHFEIPVSDLTHASDEDESSRFSAPGSIFGVSVTQGTVLTSGVPDSVSVYLREGTGFAVEAPAVSIAEYWDQPLRSGLVRNPEVVAGRSALVEAPLGSGRAILFGFRPQHRGQTNGTFKLLFNALLLSGLD